MDEPLPDEFDVIVVGTGLPESVLSGALSRINQKVLHLDVNDYYGSTWASFNINGFDDLMNSKSEVAPNNDHDISKLINSDEIFLPITQRSCVENKESLCHLSKIPVPVEDKTTPKFAFVSKVEEASVQDTNENTLIKEAAIPSKPSLEESSARSEDAPATEEQTSVESEPNLQEEEFSFKSENEPPEKNIIKPEVPTDEEKTPLVSSHEKFYDQWRRFNIDLTSKVLYSRGLLVELLIQSNVSRYLEFRNISPLLTLMDGQLRYVPCTRADVFKSKFVSVVQKRIMMRILTTCANYEEHPEIERDFKENTFVEFLVSNKLCKEAQHFIIHSIAMVNDDVSTLEGVKATKKFLQSLGRYGNSAFLFPTYGIGEIPQAFSRLSAVFGGLFCLRRYAVGLVIDQDTGKCKGIIDSTGQKIRCRHVIVDETNAPDVAQMQFQNYIARAVYVTDRPLTPISSAANSAQKSSSDNVSVISVPATEERSSVRILEAGPAASVCPPNHCLLHATAKSLSTSNVQSPKIVFKDIEELLFSPTKSEEDVSKDEYPSSATEVGDTKASEDPKPHLLWHAYFNIFERGVDTSQLPSNVYIMDGPGDQFGFDSAMNEIGVSAANGLPPLRHFFERSCVAYWRNDAEARRVFEVICPEEDFLPRAPEPDEIIFNDEGYNTEKNGSSSSDAMEEQEGEYGEPENDLLPEDEQEGGHVEPENGGHVALENDPQPEDEEVVQDGRL